MASIIIRTKNEERWITQCLREVFNQEYQNFEVIVVDNESTDKTLEKVRQFNIQKVVTIQDYLPGKALNQGIRNSKGKYIVCLSGHCIPINRQWLSNLMRNFEDNKIAGVYGRQEPMAFSSDSDKRDLAIAFGLDRKIQFKDSFFHNANSMIRRDLWEKNPFSETTPNIEDRIWAQNILKEGHLIVYDPEASVYHYHGIHHHRDTERCKNVVRILEHLNESSYKTIEVEKMNVVAIIPVKGSLLYFHKEPLIFHTIQRALESKYIKKVIVSTDDKECAKIACDLGAEVPFIRDKGFSKDYVDLSKVLHYSLEQIEKMNTFPDLILSLEPTFPFRPKALLDEMIVQLVQNGLDSVVVARQENKAIWKEKDQEIILLEEGLTPRQFKTPTFLELRGVGCVTYPEFLRRGILLGSKVGIFELNNPYSHIEVRTEEDLRMAAPLLREFF